MLKLKSQILLSILVIIIFSALAFINHVQPPKTHVYQAGCSLIDKDSKLLRLFNGYLCLFLKSGDYLSSDLKTGLSFIEATGKQRWNDPNPALHQLKLAQDQNSFLTITSESHQVAKQNLRSDLFSVRDFNNKILKSWSTSAHLEDLKKLKLRYFDDCHTPCYDSTNWLQESNPVYAGEITHANSFQEFGLSEEVPKSPIWKSGNYLIYLFGPVATALVLDSDMKEILWHYDFRAAGQFDLHDLQLLPGKKLLAFFNSHKIKGQTEKYSSLALIDIENNQTVWTFKAQPPEKFYSESRGGAQALENGHWLYSVSNINDVSAHEINSEGIEILRVQSPLKSDSNHFIPFQEIKQIEVTDFLKNNVI